MKKYTINIYFHYQTKQLLWSVYCIIFFIVIFTASCKKDETIHEDLIVDGNTPPPTDGVSTVTLNNYINKLYIDLIGRAPTADELTEKSTYIKSHDYSDSARQDVINGLMVTYEYYKNINILTSQKMLIDIDSIAIEYQINLFVLLQYQAELMGDSLTAFAFEYELGKLYNLQNAAIDLYHNTIGANEYYRRYIFNYFYDEVNMGSENFVIACFQNLFHRNPTDIELETGVAMVDGSSTAIFLMDGNSKEDFIDIVTNTLEFYQGIVIDIYSTFLGRSPTSEEMNEAALSVSASNNFNQEKMTILKSEEYAGF